MGVSEGGGKIETTQKRMVVEKGYFSEKRKVWHHGIGS